MSVYYEWATGGPTVRIISDEVEQLPHCPLCGRETELIAVVLRARNQIVPGPLGSPPPGFTAVVLRCVDAVAHPPTTYRAPCSFQLPMTRR